MKRYLLITVLLICLVSGCQLPGLGPAADGGQGFSFVVIGDTQSSLPAVTPQGYLDNIDQLSRFKPRPDFMVVVGDHIIGTRFEAGLLNKEWDEWERATTAAGLPVRHVPGNHDVWDENSLGVWQERFGPTYYSFDHKGCHFIALSTHELGLGGYIRGEQREWLKADLEAHQDAAHTFVFLHRPLWAEEIEGVDKAWEEEVRPLLARYGVEAVYCGHWHFYMNWGERDGVQYYTTGGGARPGHGSFLHFMVTTVTPEGVRSVVVPTSGNAMPHDIVTPESEENWETLAAGLRFPGVKLPEDTDQVALNTTVPNPFDVPLELRYRWDTEGTGWHMTPERGTVSIAPGGQTELAARARFDPARPTPPPELRSLVVLDGRPMMELRSSFQPLIRKSGQAPRVTEPPVLDGVVAEGEYGDAAWNTDFVDYQGRALEIHQTRFVAAYDQQALYLGVVALEDEPGGIVRLKWPRDGELWRNDYVDIFVDATFDKSTYHQFAADTLGQQYDAAGGPGKGTWGDLEWNARWQSAAGIGDAGLTIEFRIPYEALGVAAPRPGDTWGLNVCRGRWPLGKVTKTMETTAWSIPYKNFHVPANFGELTFK